MNESEAVTLDSLIFFLSSHPICLPSPTLKIHRKPISSSPCPLAYPGALPFPAGVCPTPLVWSVLTHRNQPEVFKLSYIFWWCWDLSYLLFYCYNDTMTKVTCIRKRLTGLMVSEN